MKQIEPEKITSTGDFTILFDFLKDEIENQRQNFDLDFEEDSEISRTVSLFKEYKDSMVEESFTTLTRG